MPSTEEIYKQHSKTVYKYLLSLTHNEFLSEELTQETFYQAVKNLNRYDGSCKVSTWLCAIAKNSLKVYYRKHPPETEVSEFTEGLPSPESGIIAKDEKLDILKRLHSFDGEQREVMYLRLFGDLSFKEIGEILGRTENWARVTYYRGKEKLKKEIMTDE